MKNKNLTKNQLLFKYNLDTLFWINRPKQEVIDFIEWREAKKKFSLINWIKEINMFIRIVLGIILSIAIFIRVDWTVGLFALLMLIHTEIISMLVLKLLNK